MNDDRFQLCHMEYIVKDTYETIKEALDGACNPYSDYWIIDSHTDNLVAWLPRKPSLKIVGTK
jgi:hypothetical protein